MIIGLVGFKQVGKSTAAEYLEEKYNFKRHNFKDALVAEMKENLKETLDEMIELLNTIEWDGMDPWTVDKLFRVKPPMFRALMQNYGTEVRRGDDQNYWVKQWANKTISMLNKGDNIVVDDVRFLNEAASVSGNGGKIIRLVRPDIATGGSHSSELQQLQIPTHYTIECEKGQHERLYKELDTFIAQNT